MSQKGFLFIQIKTHSSSFLRTPVIQGTCRENSRPPRSHTNTVRRHPHSKPDTIRSRKKGGREGKKEGNNKILPEIPTRVKASWVTAKKEIVLEAQESWGQENRELTARSTVRLDPYIAEILVCKSRLLDDFLKASLAVETFKSDQSNTVFFGSMPHLQ